MLFKCSIEHAVVAVWQRKLPVNKI